MVDRAGFLLDAQDVRKTYGGTIALKGVSLVVQPGETHALLGENGAGKSTLIKCLAGTPPPDGGKISVDGVTLPPYHTATAAAEAGLAFIHQEGSLVEDLSVAENIAMIGGYPLRFGIIDWGAVERRAQSSLKRLGVTIDPRARVAELPPASRTAVAIARALARSAKILVLDEPTANLGAKDVAALFGVLRRISAEGSSIVFVSHRLEEVYDLCDRVTVLRDGANVGTTRPSEVSRQELVAMICGRDVLMAGKPQPRSAPTRVVRAEALEGEVVGPVSFAVGAGEIIGFTGLSDAGHYEIGEILFGLTQPAGGAISLFEKPFSPRVPADAMKAGISYVPPDRNADGLAGDMTLTENLFLNPSWDVGSGKGASFVFSSRERPLAESLLRQFTVRPPIPDARISTLSGGNAQKVLAARWVSTKSPVLIVNDVSVGVDIGAREDIYTAIRAAAASGSAVLVITSDFEEIEILCTRALIFVRGLLRATLSGDDLTVSGISACLVSGKRDEAPAHNKEIEPIQ